MTFEVVSLLSKQELEHLYSSTRSEFSEDFPTQYRVNSYITDVQSGWNDPSTSTKWVPNLNWIIQLTLSKCDYESSVKFRSFGICIHIERCKNKVFLQNKEK